MSALRLSYITAAHVTVVLPLQSAAVTITRNMDPSVAATKTNWYNGGTTVTFGEESGLRSFTFPLVAITVDAYGAVTICLSCEDIAQQSCAMVPRWRVFSSFLCPVFSASCVQHTSDMHSKFALRPHNLWKYGRYPMSDRWDQARKQKRRKKKPQIGWKYICPHPAMQGGHKSVYYFLCL